MRIARKRKVKKTLIPHYNKNQLIQAKELRVLDEKGEYLGILPTADALKLAAEKEMDLVEINPKANPPVAQLTDFGSFKYQREKEARKQRVKSHVSELKGIRLSIRISEHDMEVRQMQAERFLNRGDKVKIEIILRGRENNQVHIAHEVINRYAAMIQQHLSIGFEQEIKQQGNKVTAIVFKK